MRFSIQNIIFFLTIATLSFLGLSVFAIDVEVTANVPGCGNDIIESNLGEQCEGVNLNDKTCKKLGYSDGVLNCNSVCTFNVTGCIINPDSPRNRSGSRLVLVEGDSLLVENTTLLLTGRAVPNSAVVVVNGTSYLQAGYTNDEGIFNIALYNVQPGQYTYTLYNIVDPESPAKTTQVEISLEENFFTQIRGINFLEVNNLVNINTQFLDSDRDIIRLEDSDSREVLTETYLSDPSPLFDIFLSQELEKRQSKSLPVVIFTLLALLAYILTRWVWKFLVVRREHRYISHYEDK